ncbi:MAG: sulfite exporter TauE/SafE family protein [Bacteroidetes bacterium]|nr:sulfite exporter TauE/SafE family protein [Bacteroidota bacterium]
MLSFPLLLTIYAGFIHAFEADHLLAVSNIVSQRSNMKSSMKDGIFWGLGHSSTIFLIGLLMIIFKVGISEHSFHYFEAMVGFMLIALAIYRLLKFFKNKNIAVHVHPHTHGEGLHKHLHVHSGGQHSHQHTHSLAYGVGLVHGLAGSGALIVIVMAQIKSPIDGLAYLLIFSMGCVVGMFVAAGLFSVPFSKRIMQAKSLQSVLIIITSSLCFVYGAKVIYENLIA